MNTTISFNSLPQITLTTLCSTRLRSFPRASLVDVDEIFKVLLPHSLSAVVVPDIVPSPAVADSRSFVPSATSIRPPSGHFELGDVAGTPGALCVIPNPVKCQVSVIGLEQSRVLPRNLRLTGWFVPSDGPATGAAS